MISAITKESEIEIDTQYLCKGLYLVLIESELRSQSAKFIVE